MFHYRTNRHMTQARLAALITDEAARHAFLQTVPIHGALMAAFAAQGDSVHFPPPH